MQSLLEKIRAVDADEESHEYDKLCGFRNEEIQSELPVPFCCTKVAGCRVVYARTHQPEWAIQYKSSGLTYSTKAIHCPFCGTALPELALKANPPPLVCGSEDEYYCTTCSERLQCCMCSVGASVWEAKDAPPVYAVVALISGSDPESVLSVSRKDDPEALGLPGGKVDPGETLEQALCREVQEETGLVPIEYHKIFDAVDETGYRCVTYRVTAFKGSLQTAEKGVVQFVDVNRLITSSPFKEYNLGLFRLIGSSALNQD